MDLPIILRRKNTRQVKQKDKLNTGVVQLGNNSILHTENIVNTLQTCGLSKTARKTVQRFKIEANVQKKKSVVVHEIEAEYCPFVTIPEELNVSTLPSESKQQNLHELLQNFENTDERFIIKYENIEVLEDEDISNFYVDPEDLVDEIELYDRTDLSCSICQKQCKDREELCMHEATHLKYKCEVCYKAFYRQAYLKKHLKSAHKPADTPRIPCEICEKTFKTKYNMQQHMLIHTGERRYKCTKCDKAFTQTSSLGTHMKYHMGIREVCTVCGVPMSRIKEHMRTHTGEKPYVCEICGRGFATTSQRKAHTITHTKIKNFKCTLCGVLFTQLSSLYKHKKSLHEEISKFPCPICKKLFNRKDNLKTHIQCVHEKYVIHKIKTSKAVDGEIMNEEQISRHNLNYDLIENNDIEDGFSIDENDLDDPEFIDNIIDDDESVYIDDNQLQGSIDKHEYQDIMADDENAYIVMLGI